MLVNQDHPGAAPPPPAAPLPPLAAATRRITSSAIRDLLAVAQRPEVISLAGGLPLAARFPADAVAAAAAEVLAEPGGTALQYAETVGHEPLRRWVADRHGVPVGRVLVTHGSQQAIDLLARAFVDPGTTVALADPAYVGALQALRLAGADLLAVPSDEHGLRVDVLAERLAAGARPALVYVVADLDNPTGATLAAERRVELARLADRYGFWIVDDEPYTDLRFAGERPVPLAELSERVITLGTTSKVLAPGLRVGWAVAPEALIDELVVLKQALDLQTATLAQHLAHHVLTRADWLEAHLAGLRLAYREQAGALSAALREQLGERIAFTEPEGGMFLWARLAGVDTRALLPVAVDHGVAFVPGADLAVHPDPRRPDDRVRLSFATASPSELHEAARRLATSLPTPSSARRPPRRG